MKNENYKIKSGLVYLCFSSDFLIEEADMWRDECWKMIKKRSDLTFLFLTKRIDRFLKCIPNDWNNGYDNVIICCTVENQKNVDLNAIRWIVKYPDYPKYHNILFEKSKKLTKCK